ncbi:heparinase II/III family protein [Phaeobacter inhibens]|uniref:heparinase II/III family protein n=1 Tax=Phaeobacter inhibens TaxID=221822 RepID=UPI000C9AB213|nr:heparinase II/III family protein [Phaeobacter inhibens]AUQ72065.1 putative heparinase II/III-like protein [Phaeobacter inhibens]UWR39681.1 heparinase II/III family protein [Phaeobacter inhibens]UWR48821.1 heparinase II/III family protein [Phaeobacter inhibens]UWR52703.1 heparinase II/III family protein [Phaeobacter inhibens]UWR64325.1 heparinase II/III family protein [Phaeobacter inhibens]
MSRYDRMARRGTRLLNRFYARRARRQPGATAFVSQPEPRTIGSFARGRQLVAGNLLFAGYLVESPTTALWDVVAPDLAFDAERHGFAWLDDLAAVGDFRAREKAQLWVWGWIDTHGNGSGPGWSPDLTGRRVIRWINHALFLLAARTADQSEAFFGALSRQTWFLSRRWQGASPGLPRFEALTGLIYAGLALKGHEDQVDPALKALAEECASQIDEQGGLPTRNPEELLEVFTLLTWAAAALQDAGRGVPPAQLAAIERIAPTLRTLRHADGGLARFHGGGRGLEGRLDHALAASHVTTRHADGLAMGYARLSGRRTSVIIDASVPPKGRASWNGHASTLAFELTSGRRPLIVNCGSGETFGVEWRRAGRATPSHSTLCIEGHSSARLAPPERGSGHEIMTEAPDNVPLDLSDLEDGYRFQGGHNGYERHFGLTHARTLELAVDGRGLAGEDMLLALDTRNKRRFDKAMDAHSLGGIGFEIRLHLHPDVDAALDLGGAAVSMALKSGEIWVFRHDGTCELKLEPSVYLEKTRLKPRAAKQIVLSGRAMNYATRIRWTLSKAQETAVAVRDLNRDDPALTD